MEKHLIADSSLVQKISIRPKIKEHTVGTYVYLRTIVKYKKYLVEEQQTLQNTIQIQSLFFSRQLLLVLLRFDQYKKYIKGPRKVIYYTLKQPLRVPLVGGLLTCLWDLLHVDIIHMPKINQLLQLFHHA